MGRPREASGVGVAVTRLFPEFPLALEAAGSARTFSWDQLRALLWGGRLAPQSCPLGGERRRMKRGPELLRGWPRKMRAER